MRDYRLLFVCLTVLVACSHVNGKGDADSSAREWTETMLPGAVQTSHLCQERDTDDNGYVTCTVSVQWTTEDPEAEIIPIECSVNRLGSGCGNRGCRPLAAFRTGGRKR